MAITLKLIVENYDEYYELNGVNSPHNKSTLISKTSEAPLLIRLQNISWTAIQLHKNNVTGYSTTFDISGDFHEPYIEREVPRKRAKRAFKKVSW